MTQIAIVVYPGFTALDFSGPYEVLRNLPGAEVRFVWHEPGPIAADSGVLLIGATHSFDETPSPDILLVPGGMTTMEQIEGAKPERRRTSCRTMQLVQQKCLSAISPTTPSIPKSAAISICPPLQTTTVWS